MRVFLRTTLTHDRPTSIIRRRDRRDTCPEGKQNSSLCSADRTYPNACENIRRPYRTRNRLRDEGTSPYTEKRSDAIESEGKRFFLFKREKWNGERNGESKRGVQQTVGNERICESANFPSEANRRIFFHHRIYNVHRRCIVTNRHVICAVNLKLINPCH